jgi:hypothetical protein
VEGTTLEERYQEELRRLRDHERQVRATEDPVFTGRLQAASVPPDHPAPSRGRSHRASGHPARYFEDRDVGQKSRPSRSSHHDESTNYGDHAAASMVPAVHGSVWFPVGGSNPCTGKTTHRPTRAERPALTGRSPMSARTPRNDPAASGTKTAASLDQDPR